MASKQVKSVYQEAVRLESQGKKKEAAQLFYSIAQHLVKRAKYSDAKKFIERAISLAVPPGRWFVLLAKVSAEVGESRQAEKAMTQFADRVISGRKSLKYIPYVDSRLMDYPSLRVVFYERLLAFDRTDADIFLRLARCYLAANKPQKARSVLMDALRTRLREASVIRVLKEVCSTDARESRLLSRYENKEMGRDELLALLSHPPEVREPTQVPVSGQSSSGEISQRTDRERDIQSLIKQLEAELGSEVVLDRPEALIQEFRSRADKVLGEDAKARMDLALAFHEMGLWPEAKAELSKISDQHPLFWQAQCLKGEILMSEGSELSALELYLEMLRKSPGNQELQSEARYRLCELYLKLNDYAMASSHLEWLERKSPGYRHSKAFRERLKGLSGRKKRMTG